MARADVFRLLLIRTGSTEWDEHEHLSGIADLPLCESARERFGLTRESAGDVPLRAVLCGDDEASRQSAEIVAASLGSKARVCPRLGDADLGLWQGLRMEEIRERSPRVYRQWVDDPLSLSPPEGEPLRDAQERLLDELSRAIERHGKGAREASPAVAVVLRPLAMALVRARLLDDPGVAGWARLCAGPAFEWHVVSATRLAAFRSPVLGGV